jgi:hypothetical protein
VLLAVVVITKAVCNERWDGMGWNGMGWNGIGYVGIRWDGI